MGSKREAFNGGTSKDAVRHSTLIFLVCLVPCNIKIRNTNYGVDWNQNCQDGEGSQGHWSVQRWQSIQWSCLHFWADSPESRNWTNCRRRNRGANPTSYEEPEHCGIRCWLKHGQSSQMHNLSCGNEPSDVGYGRFCQGQRSLW